MDGWVLRGLRSIALAVVVGTPAACFPGPISVPPEGQRVEVVIDGDTITLDPTTVRAGDVYLVLVRPGTSMLLVERKSTPEETPGPLSEAELDRVRRGDTFHTAITGGFANGEPYGNVSRIVVTPGLYAFLVEEPELLAARSGGVIPPGKMAVLVVTP